MIIHVNQITPYALTEEDGMKLYKEINNEIQKGKIIVDFNGITIFAPPFFNAVFGRLVAQKGSKTFEKIKIINLDDLGWEALEYAKKQAAALSGKDTKRISKIIGKNIFDS